jgi:hypothetical protein
VLEVLRAALAREGLHIVRPVVQDTLDRAGVDLRLSELLPGGRSGLVIGDGGPTFFERFATSAPDVTDPAGDPLDHHTIRLVRTVVGATLGSEVPWAARYPFDDLRPALPMQALGVAAGLPPAGPLGIQIHPRFGPWWAYRAFVILPVLLGPAEMAAPDPSLCATCPAPCVAACPGHAVTRAGFGIVACAGNRLRDPGCQPTCAARRTCIVAPEHAYSDRQLGFHMAASLVSVRRYFGG